MFQSVLLLIKKKHAALTVQESSDGTFTIVKGFKGLDLVRRDWRPLSKEAGAFVLDQIISGKESESSNTRVFTGFGEQNERRRNPIRKVCYH